MKVLALALLVSCASLCSCQDRLNVLLHRLGATDRQAFRDNVLRFRDTTAVADCLASIRPAQTCSPLTPVLQEVLQVINQSGGNCATCDQVTQDNIFIYINYLERGLGLQNCIKVRSALNLTNLRCRGQ